MKIFRLATVPDLTHTVSSSEFLSQGKYVEPGSLVQKLVERFPYQPPMPTQHRGLTHDPAMEQHHKFVSQLQVGEREMLWRAYIHAMKANIEKRVRNRKQIDNDAQKIADNGGPEEHIAEARFRIMQTWIERFRMEKVFHHLRIKSMDDFKKMMHTFYVRADARDKLMLRLLLKQHGLDPKSLPPPVEYMRMTGKDLEIIRDKIAREHHELLETHTMRHHIAEQLATLAYKETIENHEQVRRWDQRLWNFNTILRSHPGAAAISKAKKV